MTHTTLTVREQQHVLAPPSLLRDGRLDVYPQVLKKDLFQITVTPEGARLQARAHVGVIPLNDEVTLHVTPRVPVRNLDRLLAMTSHVPLALPEFTRDYDVAGDVYPSLVTLYASSLRAQVESLAAQGLLRRYERRERDFAAPRGRVNVSRTVQLSVPRGAPTVSTSYFERTVDSPENRLLLAAVMWLEAYARQVAGTIGPAAHRQVARHLTAAWHLLSGVTYDPAHAFLRDAVVSGRGALPQRHAAYRPVLDFARSLLDGQAVVVERAGSHVVLPTLLVNMERLFETYVREVLTRHARRDAWPEDVLDGNLRPPAGALRGLFDETGDEVEMNPDIVLLRSGQGGTRCAAVIDVKYRPVGARIDRHDLEQVLLYAVGYGSPVAVVVQPCRTVARWGLRRAGSVEGIDVYVYAMDLSGDLDAEEAALAAAVRGLC
jgi:5-methylcytosine-specific restriction enzyme subunit McrC